MIVPPVISRELRAVARRSSTYSLRVNGVAALLAVCAWITFSHIVQWNDGRTVFAYLHDALFLAIWVLVPLITADCISRERREGTLPLLFLTPLKAGDIVLAKGLAHGLTAFTLWLAVLPVLTIPIVAGGVGWRQAVNSVLVNFSSICLALGAGLVASVESKVHLRALLSAGCLGCLFLFGFLLVTGAVWVATADIAGAGVYTGRLIDLTELNNVFGAGAEMVLGKDDRWLQATASSSAFLGWMLVSLALSAALSALVLWILFRLVAWRVKGIWCEPPPSARIVWLETKFCTPLFFRRFFRRWMRWELERNPVGWLERRSWSARLVMWSWFAVVISIYTSVLVNMDLYRQAFHVMQCCLAWVLVGSMALGAAGSFRRERESGMLELLLVAPLKEWQILGGRLRGLWGQFLPAIALLFCLWLYCSTFMARPIAPGVAAAGGRLWVYYSTFVATRAEWPSILFFAGTFLFVPVIGLYFSLAKSGFLSAFLWTVLVAVVLPAFLSEGGQLVSLAVSGPAGRNPAQEPSLAWSFTPVQFVLAGWLAWRLHSDLKYRRFAIQRTTA
jgi:ABC-type transport system involved in multi-copper enzyme maturation permease subunit